ncbi:MAG: hypothetical protein QNJ00_13550 [Woeseiaceae bacterium]|nr:hypothetical protein [Woeseiaceae bacterium]
MRKRQETAGRRIRTALITMIGIVAAALAGCESPGDGDGTVINNIALPTDTVLDLFCEDVGVFPEICVLEDPANPFVTTTIIEPGLDPDNANKFQIATSFPPGPAGAKARFYFWATALARFPSGENQYFTALALHELFDANSNALGADELIREQALKAYRSQLDNFFGTVFVAVCCEDIRPPGDDRGPVPFPIGLNEWTADNLYRTEGSISNTIVEGQTVPYRRLVDGDPLLVEELLLTWGYGYEAATPPDFDNGIVYIITFP